MNHHLEEFKKSCELFFTVYALEETTIRNLYNCMTFENFKEWVEMVMKSYDDENYTIIRKFISDVRKNHDLDVFDPLLQVKENKDHLDAMRDIFNDTWENKFRSLDVIKEFYEKDRAIFEKERLERELQVTVDGLDFRAIAKCDVLWSGWECDSTAWVVEHEGKNKFVTTNHGQPSFVDVSFLKGKIDEYRKAIEQSEKLIALVEND